MSEKNGLLKKLNNMPREAYSAPFWAWNSKLDDTELCWQIDEMKKQHMGGYFIHSREGLETEYLSEEWFDRVNCTLDYGSKENMESWIYDEDKWPSGMAGGMVAQEEPQYRATALTMHMENGKPVYQIEKTSPDEWYNGSCAADNLNPESVKKFLELTHEEYEKNCGERLKTSVTGFFTDEPNICDFFSHFSEGSVWLPWSDRFAEYFEEKRGYDIWNCLDGLFFDVQGCEKVRHDYHLTIVELFSESYFKQIHEWLSKRNLKFGGHLLFENDMGYAARTSGAIMPHYEYFDMPGIDILGEQDQEMLTVKQCTSVANQLGKEYTLSETYGCSKWEFGFEGQKWVGDWQFILGIGRRCQHLHMYSLKGLRKRDYPPAFSYQNSWWKYNHLMEDYFARFHVCASQGNVVRNTLVLHPMSSVWLASHCDQGEDLSNFEGNMGWTDEHFKRNNQFGQEFASFLDGMFRMHCDFDLGDEILMQKYGGCKNGELFVGKAAYKYVVIPFIKNIFKSTLALFEQYLEQGGTILFVGECPEFVDGEQSDEAKLLYGHKNVVHAADYSEALEYVHSHFQHVYIRNIRNQEETNILMMERAEEEERIVICVNHDRENVHEVMFHLPETGKVRAIDLWSGEVEEISCETDEQSGTMKFVYLFKETESKAFLISRGEEVLEQKQRFAYHHPHEQRQVWKALTFRQEIKRSMPNVLTLDRCSYCLADNEQWSADMEIWQAQREIREQLDMMQIYYNGAVQRYQWIYDEKESKPLKLRFKFEMREIPEGEIYVGIECAENFQVFVNGEEYTTKETNGYYIDKVIKKVKVGNLRPGENEIILTCDYRNDMELEEIYLLGDFSVYADRTLGKESAGVLHGDLCFQGYYHYAGSVEYKYTVDIPEQRPVDKKLLLHIGKQEAAVTKIVINGNTVGFVPWKGRDDFDITDYVIPGTNAIVLEITSSLRNVFGPFHEVNETCIRSSWQDFRTEGEQWNAAYKVMPFGIMENPVLVFSEQEYY